MLLKMSRSKCHTHSDFFVGLPKCQQCMAKAGPWYPHLNNGLPGTRQGLRLGQFALRSIGGWSGVDYALAGRKPAGRSTTMGLCVDRGRLSRCLWAERCGRDKGALGRLRSTAVRVSCALCSNCALHLDIVVGGCCSYPALGGTGAWRLWQGSGAPRVPHR